MNRASTKEQVVEEFRCRAILDAAKRVIARKGLVKATVEEIAREAGIAKGTVYLYFPSREEVLEKTVQRAADEFHEGVQKAIDAGGAFRDVFERVLTAQISCIDEQRDFFRVYFATVDASDTLRRQRLTNHRRLVAQLVAMLAAAAGRGEIRACDAGQTASAIAGAVREVIFQRVEAKPARALADEVASLADLFYDGLSAKGGKRR